MADHLTSVKEIETADTLYTKYLGIGSQQRNEHKGDFHHCNNLGYNVQSSKIY